MGRPWYETVPPVCVQVECTGAEHTLTWRAGELTLDDHDVEAERAFTGLGGEPAACIDVLDAWNDSPNEARALAVLLAWMKEPSWRRQAALSQAAMWRNALRRAQAQRGQAGESMLEALQQQRRETTLLGLPEPLFDRYALGLLAAQLEAGDQASGDIVVPAQQSWAVDQVPQLQEILAGKAAAHIHDSLRTWRRNAGPPPGVECVCLASGEPATLDGHAGTADAVLTAALPPTWLFDVWGRGISLVDGCFVLEVLDDSDPDMIEVRAVRWERQADRTSRPVTGSAWLICRDQAWSAYWS